VLNLQDFDLEINCYHKSKQNILKSIKGLMIIITAEKEPNHLKIYSMSRIKANVNIWLKFQVYLLLIFY